MVAVVIPASVAVTTPTNLVAVIIPLVLALKLEESVDANETLLVPSNDIVLASKSPVIEKSLAFSSLVAVDAVPVTPPVIFPVTSPVNVPTNVVAVITPLARMFPDVIPIPTPVAGSNPICNL